MSIEGVTSAQIIRKLKGASQVSQTGRGEQTQSTRSDEIDISGNARFARTLSRVRERIEQAPDVRADRVAEAKQKLDSGAYNSQQVIDEVAGRIADVFRGV